MTKQYAQDREMSYEEAEYWCQIEAEQCTCKWDEATGKPIPEGCPWHDRAAQELDESGDAVARRAASRAGRGEQ